MPKKDPYREFLKEDFGQLFNMLELNDRQRHFLQSRWLDQVLWMEKKASQSRDRHYRLRLTAIVLGVIVPVLVGVDFGKFDQAKRGVTIAFSVVVAASAAIEEFFHYGERWNHYRRTVESLKTQGWQFSQLSGPYNKFPTHKAAFGNFADQVEEIIQRDVEIYVTQLAKPEDEPAQQPGIDDDDEAIT